MYIPKPCRIIATAGKYKSKVYNEGKKILLEKYDTIKAHYKAQQKTSFHALF